jgi:hypothetical protein
MYFDFDPRRILRLKSAAFSRLRRGANLGVAQVGRVATGGVATLCASVLLADPQIRLTS